MTLMRRSIFSSEPKRDVPKLLPFLSLKAYYQTLKRLLKNILEESLKKKWQKYFYKGSILESAKGLELY